MNTRLYEELFGGAYRYQALKALFRAPHRAMHLAGIAREGRLPSTGSLTKTLRGLADVGLVEVVSATPYPLYRANPRNEAFAELNALFNKGTELVSLLRQALEPVDSKLVYAGIFGSVARGTEHNDSDVDVLLVGNISRMQAFQALRGVSEQLGRPVNPTCMSSKEWRERVRDGDAFVAEIRSNPVIDLKGELDAAAA